MSKYRSFRGKWVDMEQLRRTHETTIASGNMGVNAKGDKLGPGGKIIKTTQATTRKHYATTQVTTKTNVSIKGDQPPEELAPIVKIPDSKPLVKKSPPKRKSKPRKKIEIETAEGDIIIEENNNED